MPEDNNPPLLIIVVVVEDDDDDAFGENDWDMIAAVLGQLSLLLRVDIIGGLFPLALNAPAPPLLVLLWAVPSEVKGTADDDNDIIFFTSLLLSPVPMLCGCIQSKLKKDTH